MLSHLTYALWGSQHLNEVCPETHACVKRFLSFLASPQDIKNVQGSLTQPSVFGYPENKAEARRWYVRAFNSPYYPEAANLGEA